MYICARGRLQVVDNEGKTVLATLKAGSYFGEISILNMGTAGNRRTASVRSVGYSDLFVLSKTDMWDVLKDYPAARVRLEAVAAKKIERYKKVPLEKGKLWCKEPKKTAECIFWLLFVVLYKEMQRLVWCQNTKTRASVVPGSPLNAQIIIYFD